MTPQVNVTLFVDMPQATPWQREQFRDRMQKNDWHSMADQDDTFCTAFRGRATDRDIVNATEADASIAAEASGVAEWEAVCVLSG
jgi:hypothetical protein